MEVTEAFHKRLDSEMRATKMNVTVELDDTGRKGKGRGKRRTRYQALPDYCWSNSLIRFPERDV
jgi:hypothetical protein